MHEGMTWGAVAMTRTTAIGLEELTLSNRPTSSLDLPPKGYQQHSMTTTQKNEAPGFGAEFTSRVRANQEEKYREKPLDNSASFRDGTPTHAGQGANPTGQGSIALFQFA